VRRLPRWWVFLSASAFAWCAVYLTLYPGFGAFPGLLGWTSREELARDTASNRATLGKTMTGYATLPLTELVNEHPAALRIGARLFMDNCAACHGRDARGNPLLGAPSLTDDDWLYGGDETAITTSITEGRHGAMPALGAALGDIGTTNVANHVLSLSGAPHDAAAAAAGAPLFAMCAGCHGPEGKGNPLLGAPNLSDSTWLYGGDLATIEETIRKGRGGVMPAWNTRLDHEEIHLIIAWLLAQTKAQEH
jgi:cytochrome c oxidase cbb3-type subunit 3